MTATRWWVKLAAHLLARVDGVSGMIQLAMLFITGISTATLTLRQYGHGEYAWPLIVVVLAGSLVFTYFYTEGGVWNQVSRDRQDLWSNFAGHRCASTTSCSPAGRKTGSFPSASPRPSSES